MKRADYGIVIIVAAFIASLFDKCQPDTVAILAMLEYIIIAVDSK